MKRPIRLYLFAGALFGLTGVALGAFAAHGLKTRLDPSLFDVFQTGVRYQILHALALLATGILLISKPSLWLNIAGGSFIAGVVLFSGSLYTLTLSSVPALGIVTPFGGVAFLLGWLSLAIACWKDF